MSLRLLPPGLALVAVVAELAGSPGLAHLVLLVAIVVAAARGLDAVGREAELRGGLGAVVLAGVSLLALVLAAAARVPGVALVCVAALGVEELGGVRARRPVPEAN